MKMKVTKRKPRCKRVLAIIRNKIEEFELLREDTYPPMGDFQEYPQTVAVLRYPSEEPHRKFAPEIIVSIECVIFLK